MNEEEIEEALSNLDKLKKIQKRIKSFEKSSFSNLSIGQMQELSAAYRIKKSLEGEIDPSMAKPSMGISDSYEKPLVSSSPYSNLSTKEIKERIKTYRDQISEYKDQISRNEKRSFNQILVDGRNITGSDCWQARAIASQYCSDPDSYESGRIRELSDRCYDLRQELKKRI